MKKDAARRPIIIKRVKKVGHAHHGGSWKVAYADFVTAMMAFFMVMWILGMDEHTRKSIEGYFANPTGFKKGFGAGQSPVGVSQTPVQMKEDKIRIIIHTAESRAFTETAKRIQEQLEAAHGALGSAKFEVIVGDQGLRIELIEDGSGENFFPSGSAAIKTPARIGLTIIAHELRALHSSIVVEGHTDAAQYGAGGTYSNWELSADRANAARRVLEESGLNSKRIAEVRGYADTRPRVPSNLTAPENRRISILLPFSQVKMTSGDTMLGLK